MENNENKPREGGNRGERENGRKPFHRHTHHRRPGKEKRADGAQRNPEAADSVNGISSSPARFDSLPQSAQTPSGGEAEAVKQSNTGGVSDRRPRRRRNDRRRTDNRPRPSEEIIPAEASEDYGNTAGSHVSEAAERAPKHHRRRHEHHAPESSALTRESTDEPLSSDDSHDDTVQPTFSEYITTAGSVDAEIVDELNSVSESEAMCMEAEGTTDETDTVSEPEAELTKYEIVGIRFKAGGKIYYFDPNGMKFRKNDPVIVETARGLEFGTCEIQNRTVTEREVVLPLRTVVRAATSEDIRQHESNVAHEKEAFAICSQKILDHKLGMKLIDVEYAFDASKLLFYFTAEGRVDFRELVKDLASVFRTRIELRQIGIRDETKLLGGIGICGRPFCCKTFLSDFVQVSIKMAKEQNLSLNSVKISGACGRLMCCLRYEYDTYQEEIKKTPKVDQIVATPDGDGTVIEVQPLAGLVRVRFGTKADMIPPKVYHRDDVKVIGGKGVKPKDTVSEQ